MGLSFMSRFAIHSGMNTNTCVLPGISSIARPHCNAMKIKIKNQMHLCFSPLSLTCFRPRCTGVEDGGCPPLLDRGRTEPKAGVPGIPPKGQKKFLPVLFFFSSFLTNKQTIPAQNLPKVALLTDFGRRFFFWLVLLAKPKVVSQTPPPGRGGGPTLPIPLLFYRTIHMAPDLPQ